MLKSALEFIYMNLEFMTAPFVWTNKFQIWADKYKIEMEIFSTQLKLALSNPDIDNLAENYYTIKFYTRFINALVGTFEPDQNRCIKPQTKPSYENCMFSNQFYPMLCLLEKNILLTCILANARNDENIKHIIEIWYKEEFNETTYSAAEIQFRKKRINYANNNPHFFIDKVLYFKNHLNYVDNNIFKKYFSLLEIPKIEEKFTLLEMLKMKEVKEKLPTSAINKIRFSAIFQQKDILKLLIDKNDFSLLVDDLILLFKEPNFFTKEIHLYEIVYELFEAKKLNAETLCNGNKLIDCLLMLSVKRMFLDVTRLLLSKQADVNFSDQEDGITPLIIAIKNNDLLMIELLYKHGVDLDKADGNSMTPLCWAAKNNQLNLMESLFALGAKHPNHDTEHDTPLLIAAKNGFYNIVDNILQRKINPNIRHKNGITALKAASLKNHLNVVYLIQESQRIQNEKIYERNAFLLFQPPPTDEWDEIVEGLVIAKTDRSL